MLSSRPYTFDRVVRILFSIAIIAGLIYLINLLKGVLLPFLVACLIAYIFEPVVLWLKSTLHLKRRFWAVAITLVVFTAVAAILGYIFIPQIVGEMQQVGQMIKTYMASDATSPLLPESLDKELRGSASLGEMAKRLISQDTDQIVNRLTSVVSGGVDMMLSMLDWLLMFIYVLFIMLDYDNLMRGFRLMVPMKYRYTTFRIGRDIKNSMNHYFRGQALIACIVAVLYSVGFSIIGIPLAVIIGLTIGVLFMIPYMQYITLIPVTLLCMVVAADVNIDFWPLWWKCIALYAVNEVIADLILTPKIMGKAMGLNPAIILLSLSVWGTLLGIVGMIIALPLTTLLISYYNNYLIKHSKTAFKPGQTFADDMSE